MAICLLTLAGLSVSLSVLIFVHVFVFSRPLWWDAITFTIISTSTFKEHANHIYRGCRCRSFVALAGCCVCFHFEKEGVVCNIFMSTRDTQQTKVCAFNAESIPNNTCDHMWSVQSMTCARNSSSDRHSTRVPWMAYHIMFCKCVWLVTSCIRCINAKELHLHACRVYCTIMHSQEGKHVGRLCERANFVQMERAIFKKARTKKRIVKNDRQLKICK